VGVQTIFSTPIGRGVRTWTSKDAFGECRAKQTEASPRGQVHIREPREKGRCYSLSRTVAKNSQASNSATLIDLEHRWAEGPTEE